MLQKILQLEQENSRLKEEVILLKEQLQKLLEPKEIKEKIEIKDTKTFKETTEMTLELFKNNPKKIKQVQEMLSQAEKWLLEEKESRKVEGGYEDGGRWADLQELELFRTYRRIFDFEGAQRIINSMEDTTHALGHNSRINRQETLNKEYKAFLESKK